MESILKIRELKYTYSDGTDALKGVNLDIRSGEKIAVLGSNGSGKSTLFLCINGVLKAESGDIEYMGKALRYDKKSLIEMRKNIGIVFQDPETQLFCVTVYQEVAFGPNNLKYDKNELNACVQQSMQSVDVAQFKDKPPHFLSYGQKKRVSVASVLSMDPQIIIFDEPTSALDPLHAKQIKELMQMLSERGKTIIMATHDVEMAYAWADRVIVMRDGIVCKEDTPYVIFSDKKLLEDCHLDTPYVLRVFNKMTETGLFKKDSTPPCDIDELEHRIADACFDSVR